MSPAAALACTAEPDAFRLLAAHICTVWQGAKHPTLLID